MYSDRVKCASTVPLTDHPRAEPNRRLLSISAALGLGALFFWVELSMAVAQVPQTYMYRRCPEPGMTPDDAIAVCSTILRSGRYWGRTLAEIFLNRGMAYVQNEELEKALIDFDKAIQINPALTRAYRQRELALRQRDARIAKKGPPTIGLNQLNPTTRLNAPSLPTRLQSEPVAPLPSHKPLDTPVDANMPTPRPVGPAIETTGTTAPARPADPTKSLDQALTKRGPLNADPGRLNATTHSNPPAPQIVPPELRAATAPPNTKLLANPAVAATVPTPPPAMAIAPTGTAQTKSPYPTKSLSAAIAACQKAAENASRGLNKSSGDESKEIRPNYAQGIGRLKCTVTAFVNEATSIDADYEAIVRANYTNPKDIKAICNISPGQIADDLAKSEVFDVRVAALQNAFEETVIFTEKVQNYLRQFDLGAMDDPKGIMEKMLAESRAPVEDAAGEQLKVRGLVQKIRASQKSMNTVRDIREIFCPPSQADGRLH
jgi:tetratricopeptide (TPR) repeat protein